MLGHIRQVSLLLLLLAGCAAPQWQLPPGARPDLAQQWLAADGKYRWPADDGFAATPVRQTLAAGTMLDRFGPTSGRFLSPQGASYESRALPYQCNPSSYHIYRVDAPLPVRAGTAEPWFDQPGGATQYETDETVQALLDQHVIEEPVPPPPPVPCPK
ncbi:MAG TPA: TNT domain-containing protein [Stellaceae bacterium]|nr:TNT domain-containing protein [Stellaceae bacterium]